MAFDHGVDGGVVVEDGVDRLERWCQFVDARLEPEADGGQTAHVWIGRRKDPAPREPTSGLTFDFLETST